MIQIWKKNGSFLLHLLENFCLVESVQFFCIGELPDCKNFIVI